RRAVGPPNRRCPHKPQFAERAHRVVFAGFAVYRVHRSGHFSTLPHIRPIRRGSTERAGPSVSPRVDVWLGRSVAKAWPGNALDLTGRQDPPTRYRSPIPGKQWRPALLVLLF